MTTILLEIEEKSSEVAGCESRQLPERRLERGREKAIVGKQPHGERGGMASESLEGRKNYIFQVTQKSGRAQQCC